MVDRTRSEVLAELATARSLVQKLEDELISISEDQSTAPIASGRALPLSLREYQRYGRQMILTEIGLPGKFFFFFFLSIRSSCRMLKWSFLNRSNRFEGS